jgi:SAM-dependent methyltransferase
MHVVLVSVRRFVGNNKYCRKSLNFRKSQHNFRRNTECINIRKRTWKKSSPGALAYIDGRNRIKQHWGLEADNLADQSGLAATMKITADYHFSTAPIENGQCYTGRPMNELRVICARYPLNEVVAAECKHLAGSLPDSEGVADNCTSLERVAQSAYLSLGVRCLAEAATLNDLAAQVQMLALASNRFKIEVLRTYQDPNFSKQDAIQSLADALQGGPDLRQPLCRFIIVVQKRRLWFGEIVATCSRLYRLHDAKPFHTSVSLPSRLARGLVNLVLPSACSVLDPFCGTGSILLEAQALGLQIHGVDISSKMVHISRHNLAHFGYQGIIELGNAMQCNQKADAIVTDLPYGRGVKKIQLDENLEILKHLVTLAPQAIYLADEPIPDLLTKAGYQKIDICCVSKRIGMQRYVHFAV